MSINNPGLTGTGTVALDGECWDSFGNKLPLGSVPLRIINGALAIVSPTDTNIAPPAGTLTASGNAPTLS